MHCIECKHYKGGICYLFVEDMYESPFPIHVKGTDYCSYAERKLSAEDTEKEIKGWNDFFARHNEVRMRLDAMLQRFCQENNPLDCQTE